MAESLAEALTEVAEDEFEESGEEVEEIALNTSEDDIQTLAVDTCISRAERAEDLFDIVEEIAYEYNLRYCQGDIYDRALQKMESE